MKYFHKLNLPGFPIRRGVINKLCELKMTQDDAVAYNSIRLSVDKFFTIEILEQLHRINLTPKFFIHFGSKNNKMRKSVLHSDVAKKEGVWISDCAAINWDLTPGTTNFVWYDTGNLSKEYPPDNVERVVENHAGIHYGYRQSIDVSSCIELCSLQIERQTAYLVRTDVPHQITYTSDVPLRIGISLRFDVSNFETWEAACDRFSSLIIE